MIEILISEVNSFGILKNSNPGHITICTETFFQLLTLQKIEMRYVW